MNSFLKNNISLQAYNTFGIHAKAKYFGSFQTAKELQSLIALDPIQDNPLMILGGGSNILLTKDFEGVVLKNEIPNIEIIKEDDQHTYIKAGAGVVWHDFVLFCVHNDIAGVENLSLIPGNVGAAPMQNIGAYGVEVKDVFHSLNAFHLEKNKIITLDNSECEFGYRESVFKKELKNKCVILDVTFKLNKKPSFKISYGAIQAELENMGVKDLDIQSISTAVINIRQSKLPDPKIIGNAGSFFKNPVVENSQLKVLKEKHPNIVAYPVTDDTSKLAAGWLIDNLGWKGKVIDNYGVHDKQALVLVNHGGAEGMDIFNLSEAIIQSVKEEYSITLHREVNIY